MKRRKTYITAIILILFVVLFSFFKKDKEKLIVELNASVRYENKRFIITNNDTIDFVHADISIDEYYKLRNYNLKAGESYTIWQVEFMHHNGMHFPYKRKPTQFSIWCELNDNKNGYYSKKIR